MNVAALLVLLLLGLAGVRLWGELPPQPRQRAGLVLAGAVGLLALAGLLGWSGRAPAGPTGAGWAGHGWSSLSWSGLVGPAAVVFAGFAAVAGGGPVVTALLRLADRDRPPGRPGPADPHLLTGGAWIGGLERIAVAGSLIAGWPEGVALALAVKGLGRYPELRAPAAAERFIIGTLTSVLWAAACAGVARAVQH